MQGNIYGRRPVTSSLNTTKRLWKSKFYIVGICCQSIFRNWSFPDFCIAHSFASLSLSVILLLVLDSRYLFRLSVHCHCPGQFAHYATIFELVLSECLMQNHFSPKTLGRACLSYSAVVHCTSRLSPFINNLFDWWTLRMTTMSTSSPSIIIIAYFSKTNLWNMSNLALCITLSDLSSICLYYKIFKRTNLLTWPFFKWLQKYMFFVLKVWHWRHSSSISRAGRNVSPFQPERFLFLSQYKNFCVFKTQSCLHIYIQRWMFLQWILSIGQRPKKQHL